MSGFTALNIEPEENIEEEVDDTKEIQLEEAFKLYQNALKLQSQGPDSFPDAFEAYAQLFRSEIFKYPEVISDYNQDRLDDAENVASQVEVQTLSALPTNATESSANSLPQLVYLAYKNRGEFVLDVERHRTHTDEVARSSALWHLTDASKKALGDYAEALERDDTDIDLWKKAARVAEIFASQRIVRFCLESVLAGDDDVGEAIDLSGLDEAYAAGELKEVVKLINDDLSYQQSADVKPKELLLHLLKRRNDPYPYLPSRPKTFGYTEDRRRPIGFYPAKTVMRPTARTWLSMGQAVLHALVGEQANTIDFGPGGAISIELPNVPEPEQEMTSKKVVERTQVESSNAVMQVSENDELPVGVMANGITVESPQKENPNLDEESLVSAEYSSVMQAQPGQQTSQHVALEEQSDPPADSANARNPRQTPAVDSISLPTRKRSSTVAGNEEPAEIRSKSKRLRARDSMVESGLPEEEVVTNHTRYYQDQLEDYALADQSMLIAVNGLLSKIGVQELGSLENLKSEFDLDTTNLDTGSEFHDPPNSDSILLADLRQALVSWNDSKSQAILYGHGNLDFGGGKAGLTLFLQHTRASTATAPTEAVADAEDGLLAFVMRVNHQWSNIHDVSLELLKSLLCPRQRDTDDSASSYMRDKWSDDQKQNVVQVIVREDEYLYKSTQQALYNLDPAIVEGSDAKSISSATLELVQSIFELHLDIYCSITNPSSKVDEATRVQQRDRLGRWADVASAMFNSSAQGLSTEGEPDVLVLRFLWASTTYGNKAEEIIQDHIMLCLQDLQLLLGRAGGPSIILPNNVAMPEISTTAVEQEMSRLSTLDFFMSVFDSDSTDAADVIERLEPILESTLINSVSSNSVSVTTIPDAGGGSQRNKLVAFLESGDASLKLYLWKRLQNAYQSISYTPMVVSCQLRAIETIAGELATERHWRNPEDQRQISMLKWLRDADDMVAKILVKILNESDPFESIDEDHLRSSIAAVSCLSRLLHGFALFEDTIRVGQTPAPSFKSASSNKLFDKSKDRFREMQVRLWTLQYALLREATVQCPEKFPAAPTDLTGYLRYVHIALGVRQYCRYSNKVFLKLAKSELLASQTEDDYSADVAQVLYDLHGLKFAPGVGDYEHGCPAENLDKRTALQLVPVVMLHAKYVNIRDFQKSDLKGTIDKVQQALGILKGSPLISYNKRMISAFLKSVVKPQDLYDCIKGKGDLVMKQVRGDSADIAKQGWYFLLGHITLAKYKGVKRVNPTPTDDLDVAATFFRQDLEHDTEKWETWYRLAQVYEAKIEDDLMWNSTKLNEHRQEVATLERNAIHAFSMAVAISVRNSDDHPDTAQKISEMYSEFAMRLYSSSREPLSMEAFRADKQIRHLSDSMSQTMYKRPAFAVMTPYAVWKFAVYLLRQNYTSKRKHWFSYYTLSKCLWKMFCNPEMESNKRRVAVDEVLEALTEAIEALPPKKEKANEYILEPHFKIVSIVHKMVHRRAVNPTQGVEYLQATHYARKVRLSEDDQGHQEWDQYIFEVLKKLANADKSNWHHRIIARAAHVIYDDQPDLGGALGARHEFMQQIFTKTMSLQVWKPEYERPGRHYVYTGRYVRFFVSLLSQLNDRQNLDQLLRRIRRRPTDFLDHTNIWEEVTITHVKLLRRLGKILEGHDKTVFDSLSHDEFIARSDKLERWGHDPDNTSMVLDILRDAIELKKLNNSLMKGTMIDDLIVDTYASMYEAYVSQLPPEEKAPPQPPPPPQPAPQGIFVTVKSLEQSVPVGDGRMSLGNLLTQTDGPIDVRYPSAPIGLGLHNAPIVIGTPPSSIEPPRIPTPVKPGRVKQITKVELRRRAESLLVKPPPIKTPVLSKKPVVDLSMPSRDRTGSMSVNVEADIDGQARMGTRMNELKDGAADVASRGSSRTGSLHDSADDESELSEADGFDHDVEKAADRRSMFPGLMARAGESWSRTADVADDEDGDDEGGEDEEGDDQEGQKDKMDVDGESEIEIQDSQEAAGEERR